MRKTSPVMPEPEPNSFRKSFKPVIEKNPTYKIKVFRPPEFDTKLKDYYYFTDVYIPR